MSKINPLVLKALEHLIGDPEQREELLNTINRANAAAEDPTTVARADGTPPPGDAGPAVDPAVLDALIPALIGDARFTEAVKKLIDEYQPADASAQGAAVQQAAIDLTPVTDAVERRFTELVGLIKPIGERVDAMESQMTTNAEQTILVAAEQAKSVTRAKVVLQPQQPAKGADAGEMATRAGSTLDKMKQRSAAAAA